MYFLSCSAPAIMTLQLLACFTHVAFWRVTSCKSLARSSCKNSLNAHTFEFLHTLSHTTLTLFSPTYRVSNCWNYKQLYHRKKPTHGWINSTLQSPPLTIPWQNPKIDSRLKMWVWNICQNSLTPNSRFCEALEPYRKVFLKTITWEDHCKKKSWNAYSASTMRPSNKEYNDKAWLNHTRTITINSDHNEHSHKEWTSGHAS